MHMFVLRVFLLMQSSRGSAVKELKLPDPNQVVSLSFGKIEPDPSARFEQVTSTFTLASSEESGRWVTACACACACAWYKAYLYM